MIAHPVPQAKHMMQPEHPATPLRLARSFLLPLALLACTSGGSNTSRDDTSDSASGAAMSLSELPPGSGAPDTLSLEAIADSAVHAIANRRWQLLAALAHPDHGVRFSPYGYVDTTVTRRLMPAEVAALGRDTTTRRWGTADGTGDPLEFTFEEYYTRFLHDKPYESGRRGPPDEVLARGNSLLNVEDVFPWRGTTFVEYHLEGTEQYGGMDWGSLRVVMTREAGRWYLVGIVNDRWTI